MSGGKSNTRGTRPSEEKTREDQMVTPPEFDRRFCDLLEELFAWRRDVRRFKADPLPAARVKNLVRIAASAPSVGNSQPWRFVSVESKAAREAVIENFNSCNAAALASYEGERAALYARLKLAGLNEAPVHLAVFCDHTAEAGFGLGRKTMPETFAYSVVCAVHSLWLAARAQGIGVGWVSILDPAGINRVLRMPEAWKLIAYLCLGFPQEEHLDPELARHGWQPHLSENERLLRR